MKLDPRLVEQHLARMNGTAPAAAPAAAAGTAPASDGAIVLRREVPLNKIEQRYADRLAVLLAAKLIKFWRAHPMSLRNGPSHQYYRPDFLVERLSGRIVLVEVKATWSDGKGHVEDDGLEKFKDATTAYPCFDLLMVRGGAAGWVTMYRSEGAEDL